MSRIEYSLFRAKFIKNPQGHLFSTGKSPEQILLRAIKEKPSVQMRAGYEWHIGNVELFSAHEGYFAVGRTTNATVEKFDSVTGNFVLEELETSPYTHVVFNSEIGFLAIARKNKLAPGPESIAHQIERLLGRADAVLNSNVYVEVLPIRDPKGFLKELQSAYRIRRFTATFRGPNPFDADKLFQKPLAVYLKAAEGTEGKTEIKGENLNCETLTEVTRSTAATGNEASARILPRKGQPPATINLSGDPVKKTYEEPAHDPKKVVKDMERIYDEVRKND